MLNPRQVEAFRAVMATGGVTSAAQVMHVTVCVIRHFMKPAKYGLICPTRSGFRPTLLRARSFKGGTLVDGRELLA